MVYTAYHSVAQSFLYCVEGISYNILFKSPRGTGKRAELKKNCFRICIIHTYALCVFVKLDDSPGYFDNVSRYDLINWKI